MDIEHVANIYQELTKHNLALLEPLYHPQVRFEDPAHVLNGWSAVANYFDALYANVITCHFDIQHCQQTGQDGFLVWTMSLQHSRLNKGQLIYVHGTSHVKFTDGKIIYHRDYFDLGEMLYENLPLLRRIITFIKTRLAK